MEIKLSDPEKSQGGFLVRVTQKAPFVTQWEDGKWSNQEDLTKTIKDLQSQVLQMLYEKRSSWFSSPPTKSVLAKLMTGWDLTNLAKSPDTKKNLTGSQSLSAVHISATGIVPRFVASVWNEAPKISMPWSVSGEDELEEMDDSREINIDVDTSPVHLTNHEDRDYLDRKFAAKERVKEARLKAHVAKKMAQRELRFFYENFNLEDNESTFSDYDLTDDDETEGGESEIEDS
jgi:hypothetical protein